ncbi:hypothetical protein [Geodermatophilus amargosae]|uniref:hypothetical protein n=1 Tax=Geodermatophilus amargosae TaxID=1296565 RepID=UPI00111475D5|nr:hypothetical protein [Geodermatophilus amargosae]
MEMQQVLKGVHVYQPTRQGYEMAESAGVVTKYLPRPSPGTLEHTLSLNDLLISWEMGEGWLPDGFPRPVTVVTEREITAADKAPATNQPSGVGLQWSAKGNLKASARDEPVHGYLDVHGRRRYPDALILPVGWERGMSVRGAIAVEYERSEKEAPDYRVLMRGYRRATIRGKYAHVLYISPRDALLNKVAQAAEDVNAPPGMLQILRAPEALWGEQPQRTTPGQLDRDGSCASVVQRLSGLPKDHLIAYLVARGLADDALEDLTAT